MKRLVIVALLGGIAMFVWGYVFWNVLPGDTLAYKQRMDDRELMADLQKSLQAPNSYLLIATDSMKPTVATVHYRKFDGFGEMLVGGFLHMIASAALIGFLLQRFTKVSHRYVDRLLAISCIGFVAAFIGNIGDPIWFTQPWAWNIVHAAYDFSLWVLAGAIAAGVIRPAPAET